nr:uncharacterized protein LOC109988407 [Labrus bergylta]
MSHRPSSFTADLLHLAALFSECLEKRQTVYERCKVFGVPLENLPRRYIPEFGLVPCFLVDACSLLLERAGTVGLFRKPGSLPRIKIIRVKLNRGEGCLSTSLPYDVSTLIKQFCRELPEPLFPSELHAALLKAQALSDPQDRTSALQLLSCLLPARNSSCLHYLFDFLSKISQRCSENLMTSSNLATVFAPCLYLLQTRRKCPRDDLNSEFWSFAPSLKILTYSTVPWIKGKPKFEPPVPEQKQSPPQVTDRRSGEASAWRLSQTCSSSGPAFPVQMTEMGSAVRLSLLGLLLCLQVGRAPARSPRTVDQVSEADIQRLLHGVMEQLGIARPRVEYPAHQATNIVGPQSIQGGAHEGLQHLGPFGNIPNIVAELTGDNVPKDFSEDHGYPDPPNPCPLGKTAADGCLENAPDTAEFSKEFQKHQHLFDPEHDYPALAKWNKELLYQKLKGGPKRRKRSTNPYLMGQRLENVVAKKSVPHFSEEEEDVAPTVSVARS